MPAAARKFETALFRHVKPSDPISSYKYPPIQFQPGNSQIMAGQNSIQSNSELISTELILKKKYDYLVLLSSFVILIH